MESQRLQRLLDDARRELSISQVCPHCGEGVAIRDNQVVAGNRRRCLRNVSATWRVRTLTL